MNKYISLENEQKINELINDENAELIMKCMINKYTEGSLNRAQDMLSFINDIVSNIIKCTSIQIQELNQASWMLIFQNEMDETDVHTYFATILPVCKTLFPNGYPENGNLAQKKYFEKFIELCKNKKAFSWDKKSDVQWAISYNYGDYLDMIFKKYIDRGENKV